MKPAFSVVFLFLFFALARAQIGANYDIIVSQNGNSFVLATFSGDGMVVVPLPSDAAAPYVRGALYSKEKDSLLLSLSRDMMATVSYRTNEMTHKSGEMWGLSLLLPENITNLYVSIALPRSALISAVNPSEGVIMNEGDSVVVAWSSASGLREVRVEYKLQDAGSAANIIDRPKFEIDFWVIAIAGGAFILLLIFVGIFLFYKFRAKPEMSLSVTEGMRNVMKAMNENDVKVVEELLEAGGEMKRSELERKSGIAKSSLALSLDRLEKNGAIKINKETTTHRISLTEWFRSL